MALPLDEGRYGAYCIPVWISIPFTLSLCPPPPLQHTHIHSLSLSLSLSLSHTHTHTHARTHARTHTRTHARTHTHTHTHTHTQTHLHLPKRINHAPKRASKRPYRHFRDEDGGRQQSEFLLQCPVRRRLVVRQVQTAMKGGLFLGHCPPMIKPNARTLALDVRSSGRGRGATVIGSI